MPSRELTVIQRASQVSASLGKGEQDPNPGKHESIFPEGTRPAKITRGRSAGRIAMETMARPSTPLRPSKWWIYQMDDYRRARSELIVERLVAAAVLLLGFLVLSAFLGFRGAAISLTRLAIIALIIRAFKTLLEIISSYVDGFAKEYLSFLHAAIIGWIFVFIACVISIIHYSSIYSRKGRRPNISELSPPKEGGDARIS